MVGLLCWTAYLRLYRVANEDVPCSYGDTCPSSNLRARVFKDGRQHGSGRSGRSPRTIALGLVGRVIEVGAGNGLSSRTIRLRDRSHRGRAKSRTLRARS